MPINPPDAWRMVLFARTSSVRPQPLWGDPALALADAALDADALRQEAVALLQQTVGFDRWCWPLADPEALIPLSGLAHHDYGPSVPRVLELEFSGADVAPMDDVARRRTQSTSDATGAAGDSPANAGISRLIVGRPG